MSLESYPIGPQVPPSDTSGVNRRREEELIPAPVASGTNGKLAEPLGVDKERINNLMNYLKSLVIANNNNQINTDKDNPKRSDIENPLIQELRILTINNGGEFPDLRCLLAALYGLGIAGNKILREHFRGVKIETIAPDGIHDIKALRRVLNLRSGYNNDDSIPLKPNKEHKDLVRWIILKAKTESASFYSIGMLKTLVKLAERDGTTLEEAAEAIGTTEQDVVKQVKSLTDIIPLPARDGIDSTENLFYIELPHLRPKGKQI